MDQSTMFVFNQKQFKSFSESSKLLDNNIDLKDVNETVLPKNDELDSIEPKLTMHSSIDKNNECSPTEQDV